MDFGLRLCDNHDTIDRLRGRVTMKHIVRLLASGSLAMAMPAMAQEAIPSAPIAVIEPTPLPGWMAGCWITPGDSSQTEECWTIPRGMMMLGSSHTFIDVITITQPGHRAIDETRTVSFEHMRIVQEGGTLVFIAQPGGAPPTRFVMVGTGTPTPTDGVVFQNLTNDYPQRVHYYLDADGALVGEISMMDGSRVGRWVYRRAG